ncbi:substrate-binding domain-containing protein [Pleurocapsa sp. PCC 7319]|uniref:substrate-binding domain-containing protein n=1 Tax=Pleurocapsa sp. PCC 7319 TaxID=118161 RepID=UPI00034577C1|nr:substrate-binding domain-containing protein [Pleurocapsa sp. PCC 7319]
MPQKNDTLPLILALISTILVMAVGFLWLKKINNSNISNNTGNTNSSLPESSSTNSQANSKSTSTPSSAGTTFTAPNIVPQGTAIAINGSTSLVQTNQALKKSFQRQFPGTAVITNAEGSETGIKMLKTGDIDLAAISRPLNDSEQVQGLVAVPIVKDAIAVFVGVNNPFRRGLTNNQVVDIFQGNLTNWSQLGGKNQTIRVLNRPQISGTRQVFQTQVLPEGNFDTGSNFITMERDATTPIIRALGTDGISYATYAQVANQQTVRIIAIDGLTPEANNYPYQRVLYYAYREPASLEVEAFLGYALSSQGQKAISNHN